MDITNPLSNMSYTQKDFQSIYPELLDLVKKLTYKWDPSISNESDPGVILLKLNALIADKNNYNIDKNVLECFPSTVTQDSNARQLFEQLGYNMSWYKGGTADISFRWVGKKSDDTVRIARFTMVSDSENRNVFTIIENKDLPCDGTSQKLKAIQGVVLDYDINGERRITTSDLDYNNRLYFLYPNIAQNGIFISNYSDSDSSSLGENWNSWEQKSNLLVEQLGNTYYKFGVDTLTNTCYIEFPEDADELFKQGIRIKYIRTDGEDGNIGTKVITNIYSLPEGSTLETGDVSLYNLNAVTNGFNPESIDSAYKNYKKTVGTFETLVTLRDYINYINNSGLVSNCFVCDRTNDIQDTTVILSDDRGLEKFYTSLKQKNDTDSLNAFNLKMYLLKYVGIVKQKSDYDKTFEINVSETLQQHIKDSFDNIKSIQHDFVLPEASPKYILGDDAEYNEQTDANVLFFKNKYPLSFKIIPHTKLTGLEQREVQLKLLETIYSSLNSSQINFGEEADYESIYDIICNCDERINYIYLEDFQYETYAVVNINDSLHEIRVDGDYEKDNPYSLKAAKIIEANKTTYKLSANENGNLNPNNYYTDEELKNIDAQVVYEWFGNYNELRKIIRADVYAKNILAGKTQLYVYDNAFKYHVNQKTTLNTDGECAAEDDKGNKITTSSISKIDTNANILFKFEDNGQQVDYAKQELGPREVIQFSSPNLVNVEEFSTYVKYEYYSAGHKKEYTYSGVDGTTQLDHIAAKNKSLYYQDARINPKPVVGEYNPNESFTFSLESAPVILNVPNYYFDRTEFTAKFDLDKDKVKGYSLYDIVYTESTDANNENVKTYWISQENKNTEEPKEGIEAWRKASSSEVSDSTKYSAWQNDYHSLGYCKGDKVFIIDENSVKEFWICNKDRPEAKKPVEDDSHTWYKADLRSEYRSIMCENGNAIISKDASKDGLNNLLFGVYVYTHTPVGDTYSTGYNIPWPEECIEISSDYSQVTLKPISITKGTLNIDISDAALREAIGQSSSLQQIFKFETSCKLKIVYRVADATVIGDTENEDVYTLGSGEYLRLYYKESDDQITYNFKQFEEGTIIKPNRVIKSTSVDRNIAKNASSGMLDEHDSKIVEGMTDNVITGENGISIQEKNEIVLYNPQDNYYCYFITKDTNEDSDDLSDDLKSLDKNKYNFIKFKKVERYRKSLEGEKNKDSDGKFETYSVYEKVLGSEEYFLYTTSDKSELNILGSGTSLTLKVKDAAYTDDDPIYKYYEDASGSILYYVPKVDFSKIDQYGTDAFEDDDWKLLSKSDSYHICATEQKFQNIGFGYNMTIKPRNVDDPDLKYNNTENYRAVRFTKDGFERDEDEDSEQFNETDAVWKPADLSDYIITYKSENSITEETLQTANGVDLDTKGVSKLNFTTSSENYQVLEEGHSITLYKENGDSCTIEGEATVYTSNALDLEGGTNLNTTFTDINGENVYTDFYYFKDVGIGVDDDKTNGSSLDLNEGTDAWEYLQCLVESKSESNNGLKNIAVTSDEGMTIPKGTYIITVLPILTTTNADETKIDVRLKATKNPENKDEYDQLSLMSGENSDSLNINRKNYLKLIIDSNDPIHLRLDITNNSDTAVRLNLAIYNLYKLKIDSNTFNDTETTNIQSRMSYLDEDHYYNYAYVVPEDDLVKNPLEAKSFFDTNHYFNKYTIPQIKGNISQTVLNKVR